MKRLVVGLLAHVDAGKTTLSENLLYRAGAVRSLGRVDHKDTFLDTHALERERGITIFSKQARMTWEDTEIILMDTPGHVDFSAEMERTLSVLDVAILLISASDGVNPYTKTLFSLLEQYEIPTFIFVNKMDLGNIAREDYIRVLQEKLHSGCQPFDAPLEGITEDLACLDEAVLERYMETEAVDIEDLRYLVTNRKLFPCYFGSALKNQGIEELLQGVVTYGCEMLPQETFAARVYKITHHERGQRVTFMRLLGGSLRPKEMLVHPDGTEEKIDQLRLYSGDKFTVVDHVDAGDICGVIGVEKTYAGEALGDLQERLPASFGSVISYRVLPVDGHDLNFVYQCLQVLGEEDPSLKVKARPDGKEVSVCLMGDVQIQIITRVLAERFGLQVEFDLGEVIYQESIQSTALGIGHYEPLRHYAEVHLLVEPAPPGSGITYTSVCSTDLLALPYQKQILNALEQDVPVGVLMGAPLTDVNVKLLAGRAHEKHTEGGDLRQAARRALRQALMQATNVLLEPYERFTIAVPASLVGRLMTDLKRLSASYGEPGLEDGKTVLTGMGPVSTLTPYRKEVYAYTGGDCHWDSRVCGFRAAHDPAAVVQAHGYDPEMDMNHSPDSVFCAHGAGFVVKWNEVENYAHVPKDTYRDILGQAKPKEVKAVRERRTTVSTAEELDELYYKTFGQSKRERYPYRSPKTIEAPSAPATKTYQPREKKVRKPFWIIDGYNVIHAWQELRELADINMDGARDRLLDILVNYQSYTKRDMMVVFDAYRRPNPCSKEYKQGEVSVVFTAKNESADLYIEKLARKLSDDRQMTVVTSDGLEQLHVFSQGAARMPSTEFYEEIQRVEREIAEKIK